MLATDEDFNWKIIVKIFVYINRCIITGKQLFNIYKDKDYTISQLLSSIISC